MTTPATPRATARRVLGANVEPSKDVSPVKIDLPEEGVKGTIREQIGAKEVTYEGTIKRDVKENEITLDDAEDISFLDDKPTPQIPKTRLETMFDDITNAVEAGEYDGFYAAVARQPDVMQDRFRRSCADIEDLGVVQFTSKHRFVFNQEIQRLNGDSGGRFNISVWRLDNTRLEVKNANSFNDKPVGLINHKVTDPIKTEVDNAHNGNGNNQPSELTQLLKVVIERQEATDRKMFELANRKHEPSQIETLLMTRAVEQVMNPAAPASNGFEAAMTNMMMLPVMVNKMAAKMFPETPPPESRDWMDKLLGFAETEAGQEGVKYAANIGANVALTALSKFGTPPQAPNAPIPQAKPSLELQAMGTDDDDDSDDMQTQLLNTILNELESDRPIDATNETLKALETSYPQHIPTLKIICKGAEFEQLVQTLQAMMPDAFTDYVEMTAEGPQYNERGRYVIDRLRVFHELVKNQE